MTTVEVSLRVWGDAPDVADLRQLGLGEGWAKGDPVPGSRGVMRRKQGGWELYSALRSNRDLDDQVASILDRIQQHWPKLLAAATSGHAELSVAIYMSDRGHPACWLSVAQVKALAEIGADLDFDIYPFKRAVVTRCR